MMFTFFAGYRWVFDPRTAMISLTDSFLNHPLFIMGFIVLGESSAVYVGVPVLTVVLTAFLSYPVIEFAFGVHKLVVAPHIITNRTRSVLSDFNMSCDDSGKLILKPRPNMGNQQQPQPQAKMNNFLKD